MISNDAYITACCGFDALAQAIEAYWNRNATDKSDEYALRAIACLWKELPQLVSSSTPELRSRVMHGAYLYGQAINITKTTAPHAVSYPYTSYYGYPHGHAVALNFAKIAAYNVMHGDIPNKKKEYFQLLFEGITESDICHTLDAYISRLGLTRREFDAPYDIQLILNNVNPNRLVNNPVRFTSKTLITSLRK